MENFSKSATTEKLLPCIFCGDEKPLLQKHPIGTACVCYQCGANLSKTKSEDAIALWNGAHEPTKKLTSKKFSLPEQTCYCDKEISLQFVAGGGNKLGRYGSVTLQINGEYVEYVRMDESLVRVQKIEMLEAENARLKQACEKSSCLALDNAFKVEKLERRNAAILEIVNALFNGKVPA